MRNQASAAKRINKVTGYTISELKDKLNDDYSRLGKSPKPKAKRLRSLGKEPKEALDESAEVEN